MVRKSIAIGSALALLAIPAAAFAGELATGPGASVGYPVSKISPLKILTPTAQLTTGGSMVKVTVKVNTTGTQGFVKPALITVCAGVAGCKALTLKVNTGSVPTGVANFPLDDIAQGPVKVSLMITAASESYRSVLKNFTVTAS